MLRKAPDLPGTGRPQQERHAAEPDRPTGGSSGRRRPGPAAIAIEAQVRIGPGRGPSSRRFGAGRRSVDDVRPEPLEPCTVACIDEGVVVHALIIGDAGPARAGPDPWCA